MASHFYERLSQFSRNAMRTLFLPGLAIVFCAACAHAGMFDLHPVKMALWFDGEGDNRIQIMTVPAIHGSHPWPHQWELVSHIAKPFMLSERPTQDLNIVSLYRIKTQVEYDAHERPIKFVIDISNVENTRQLGYTTKQVTLAAAICIRSLFPKKLGVPLVVRDGTKETPIEPPKNSPTTIFSPENSPK